MAAEHVADGEVAVRVVQLRGVHGLVRLEPATGEGGETVDHALRALGRAHPRVPGQGVGGDGAGVDHRVARASGSRPSEISLNASPDGSTPTRARTASRPRSVSANAVGEGLGDRLDRELGVGIARAVDLTVDRGEDCGETLRGRCSELRDVLRQRAGGVRSHAVESLGQVVGNG